MKQGRAKVVERIAQNMTSDEFSQLVRQYERLVYTICYQFTKDHQLAEDLAQETFLSAYTHRDDCPARQLQALARPHCHEQGQGLFEKRLPPARIRG